MNLLKRILFMISHFLLAIVRVLRKAICCRRRKEDSLLPITISQANVAELYKPPDNYQFHSHWEAWPQNESASGPVNNLKAETNPENHNFSQEESPDDFFKDMVPQIRKPKKIYIRKDTEDREECIPSNRLAMDPTKAILSSEPDLGVIDDCPSNWEDVENLEDDWDPNQLIRETKRAEREKRLAEHQRRKQERESRRASKQNSANSIAILNLSDSKDKTKSS